MCNAFRLVTALCLILLFALCGMGQAGAQDSANEKKACALDLALRIEAARIALRVVTEAEKKATEERSDKSVFEFCAANLVSLEISRVLLDWYRQNVGRCERLRDQYRTNPLVEQQFQRAQSFHTGKCRM